MCRNSSIGSLNSFVKYWAGFPDWLEHVIDDQVTQWLELVTDDQVFAGSNPTEAAGKLCQFPSPTLPESSGTTLNAVGSFYLVSMPGEVKYPTHGVNV